MTEPYRWQQLADYNRRKSQGIVHTPEFEAAMRLEQVAFDNDQRAVHLGAQPRLVAPNKPEAKGPTYRKGVLRMIATIVMVLASAWLLTSAVPVGEWQLFVRMMILAFAGAVSVAVVLGWWSQ